MTGNNKIRVIYDPYQQEIRCEYMSAAGNIWEAPQAGGKLAAMFPNGKRQGSLQNCVHDIVCGIEKDFCTTGQGVDLFFCGTEEDWVDLKKVVEQEESSKITCVGSAGQLECAKDVLPKIKEIFQNLSNDFEGLTENDEVKKPIDQFLTTIKPDVVLYVSGTYSTGKSTFINALIGEELLPSAIDPTTAHIFKIEALPEGDWTDIKVRFKYREQETGLSFNQDGYSLENLNQLPDQKLKAELDERLAKVEHGPGYVHEALSVLNGFDNTLAEKGIEETPVSSISSEIEVSTPFYNSTLPLKDFHFLIYDTPGTNAANHRDHLAVMQESLKEQTNGLPILLVTPTQIDATEVEKLRNEIHELGGALDESNILVVVTQADKETFASLKRSHQNQKAAAFENAENRICYTSAAMGFYSKKGNYPTMGVETEEEQEETLEKLDSNSTSYKNGRTRLYMIDSLPDDQMEIICEEGNLANENGSESEKLLHNSGLWAIEREIERFARRFAAYNKCWQAQVYLSQAIETTKRIHNENKKYFEESLDKAQTKFNTQQQELVANIGAKSEDWLKCSQEQYELEQERKFHSALTSFNKKRLSETVKEEWKQKKKQEGSTKKALALFEEWANQYLSNLIYDTKKNLEKLANDFWKDKIYKYKQQCIQLVKGSSALTSDEKAFLEKYILNARNIEYYLASFSLKRKVYEHTVLFIKLTRFNSKLCTDEMNGYFYDKLTEFNEPYLQSVKNDINHWTRRFINGLKQKLVEFNPDLANLNQKIHDYSDQIEKMRIAQERLKIAKDELNSCFTLSLNSVGGI